MQTPKINLAVFTTKNFNIDDNEIQNAHSFALFIDRLAEMQFTDRFHDNQKKQIKIWRLCNSVDRSLNIISSN